MVSSRYRARMHVAVTAVGADRPGIVAAVTRVLFEHGANIEDSRMAILGGHFAMVLIVSARDATNLESALQEPARALDLVVSARPVADVAAEHAAGAPYTVSVYGADKPGIVARVSGVLAEHRVNIADLSTHVIEGEAPVYVMLLDVTLPVDGDAATVETALKSLGVEMDVDVSMHPDDADTL